jgi:hypothetical protein
VSALDGTTTLPGVGTVKKGYVAVGVALTAGIVGYAWYRRTQGADATGGDLSYFADTRTGSELPTDTYTNPAPNADGVSGTGIGGDSVWHAPNTDPEWSQAAIEALSWYEPGFVSAIVGKYLSRQPLSAQEANVVREAWAQIGHPPGNQLIVTSSTGTGTGTGTGTPPPPATDATMPYPTNQKLSTIRKVGRFYNVTMTWETVGRPSLVLTKSSGHPAVPAGGSTHSRTFTGLNRGPHTFGLAYVKGTKTGPWHNISATL